MKTDEVRRVFDRLKPALRDLVAAAADAGPSPRRSSSGAYRAAAQHELSLVVTRAFGADDGLPPRPDRPSVLQLVRDTGRPADDAVLGRRPPRQLPLLDHARGRPRAVRARRRPCARPHAAGDRLLLGAPRVAEQALGERDRALASVLALVLSVVPRRRSRARSTACRSSDSTARSTARPRRSSGSTPTRRPTGSTSSSASSSSRSSCSAGSRPPICRTRGTRSWRISSASVRRTTGWAAFRTSTGRAACSATSRRTSSATCSPYRSGSGSSTDLPDAYEQVERGAFAAIYEWLREQLYRHGRKFTPAETIERVAGGPIDPEPYLRYLADKNASLAAA